MEKQLFAKLRVDKKPKISTFQFKIDQENLIYYGENNPNEPLSDLRSDLRGGQNYDTSRWDHDIIYSSHLSDIRNVDIMDSKRIRVDTSTVAKTGGTAYGEGIKTLR